MYTHTYIHTYIYIDIYTPSNTGRELNRGILLTFGTFQTYYEQILPDKSASDIAWISTVSAFLLLFLGVVTGTLYDYGYLRVLLFGGSLLEVFGLMMVSLSTKYYQLFLAQGICLGLGGGMLYIPALAAAAAGLQPFRRAKFIGLIASGAGIGRPSLVPLKALRRLLYTDPAD